MTNGIDIKYHNYSSYPSQLNVINHSVTGEMITGNGRVNKFVLIAMQFSYDQVW